MTAATLSAPPAAAPDLAPAPAKTPSQPAPDERELVIARILDAPRNLVFRVWTEKEHLVRWSAPHGFTITHCEGDLRPGGAWRSCMKSPEGVDYWVGGVYREVVPNERLVFTHAWDKEDGQPGPETLVEVRFYDHEAGKTRFEFRQTLFTSVESRDGHRVGWSESFDRMGDYLQGFQAPVKTGDKKSALTLSFPSEREIVLTRTFNAPRHLVFEAWTKPEHVARWYGCHGSEVSVCEIDLRIGGAWRFGIRMTNGSEFAMYGVYREIVAPERLVYTEIFSMYPEHEALITTILEERDGKTIYTSTALYESVEVRDAVLQSGMEEGAGQTLDRLAELLTTLA